MNEDTRIRSLRERIEAFPRRIEYLGGQQFSYVKLDDVLAVLDTEGDRPADEELCVCGHGRDEHGNDGEGHCGTGSCRKRGPAECKQFRLATRADTEGDRPTEKAIAIEALKSRLAERHLETLALCPDHRDKGNGHRCIVCQAEERTRRELADTEGDQPTPPQDRVTRLEVIGPKGRLFTKWDCGVQLSYQDGGRTLKVFVDWAALPDPPVQP